MLRRMSGAASSSKAFSFLTQRQAQMVDEELMGAQFGFSLEQLMELAGLSCSAAIERVFPPASFPRVLVVCGPGNNGGDGLVCARHLFHFGYQAAVVYPREPKKDFFKALLVQCKTLGIPTTPDMPGVSDIAHRFDVVVDAVFGFSFSPQGSVRPPYDSVMEVLTRCPVPVACIDIPSGWHVEEGDVEGKGVKPRLLISLTAPKLCAKHLPDGCEHYLGGRFLPPELATKFEIKLPPYTGSDQFVKL